jgi:glycolate oxidase FAD binding subunit
MVHVEPATAEEVAEILEKCTSGLNSISVSGNNSKQAMAGPVAVTDYALSTRRLNKILDYESRDLTISVEAGYPFHELQTVLARHNQMIALDPPYSQEATVGGIVASNSSGPLRRGYGTARDLVIGMKFATLEGKLIQAGGMVVKNVAGLDMGKMLIGSFGTLAILTAVNFRLHSIPEATGTFLYSFPELEEAVRRRNSLLASTLQPIAVDLLSPALSLRFSRRGYVLAVRAGGSEEVLRRYQGELSDAEVLRADDDETFWKQVREFPSEFLEQHTEGVVIRVSTTLQEILNLPKTVSGAFIARAASGVSYFYFPSWAAAAPWWRKLDEQGLAAAVEFAPNEIRERELLWLGFRTDKEKRSFAIMEKVKQMFDPKGLLNAKRLYGRI